MLSWSQREKERHRAALQAEAQNQWARLQSVLLSLPPQDQRREELEEVQAFLARAFELL